MTTEFAEYIIERRESLGMIHTRLAEKSGVDQGNLSYLMRGKTKDPTLLTATRLLSAVNVSMEEFASDFGVDACVWEKDEKPSILEGGDTLSHKDVAQLISDMSLAYDWMAGAMGGVWTGSILRDLAEGDYPFSIEQQYPKTISANDIEKIFLDGGILVPQDASAYVSSLTGTEIKHFERYRLSRALTVAKRFPQSFQVLWEAYSYQDKVWKDPNPPKEEMDNATMIVVAHRWITHKS